MGVSHVFMVYDADGGLLGELAYVLGTLRGRHCGLCEITHGRLRAKPEFEALRCSLGVPVDVWHRNEQTAEVAAFTAGIEPVVVGRLDDDKLTVLLDAAALDACDGRVDVFAGALDAAMAAVGGAAAP